MPYTNVNKRLDEIFPDAGGFEHLKKVRESRGKKLKDSGKKAGRTSFHPVEVKDLEKIFDLLADDENARATLACWLAFAQLKNDCADF